MPGRFETLALVVLVTVTFVACVAISYQIGEQHEHYYSSRTRADHELAQNSVAPLKNRRPAADSSICRESETEKEYELCQAWRSAEAAKESASAAWLQIVLSLGALVGLYFTVRYTAQAAHGARKAAEAAEHAIDVQIRLESPLLFIHRITVDKQQLPNLFIRNAGKSPAILTEWIAHLQIDGTLPAKPVYGNTAPHEGIVLEYGQEQLIVGFNTGPKNLEAVMNDKREAFLWGYVVYEDVLGKRRRMGFGRWTRRSVLAELLINGAPHLYWTREGEDEYNYDREVKPTTLA